MTRSYLERFPELQYFIEDLEERFLRSHLPADQIILDDVDVQKLLKISRRKLSDMRAKRQIQFHPTGEMPDEKMNKLKSSPVSVKGVKSSKIYYTMAAVLAYAKRNTVNPIYSNRII